jgi:hypothetical protein
MAKRTSEMVCEQCIHWDRMMDDVEDKITRDMKKVPSSSGMGTCRKNTATPIPTIGQRGPVVIAVWPTTPKNTWCGQWEKNDDFVPLEKPAKEPELPKSRLIV